jgi:hypothetical protein
VGTEQGCWGVSDAGTSVSNRSLRNIRQRASHAHLSKDVSRSPAPPLRSPRARLDALIVPASRPASFLQPAIELSALLGVLLVVMCSKQTRVEHVAQRVSKSPGARSLVVEIPVERSHSAIPTRTSDLAFKEAQGGRNSDLSAKRNLGLLLARLNGWGKIAFIDDDIKLVGNRNIARLAGQLETHQVAGMVVRRFPDNSVVCHARRLAGLAQDVFVTGAVLGVHCNSLPLSFFPNIYNEDWFFFAEEAATRRLPRVGHAVQAEYDPFANPERACREEFGDLLAEGLYALMGENGPSLHFDEHLRGATLTYWSRFIDARYEAITEAKKRLSRFMDPNTRNGYLSSALDSLAAAERQLDMIKPDLCVNFFEAWRQDLNDWQRFSNGVNNVGSTREAMDFLGLKNWSRAEFGAVIGDSQSVPQLAHAACWRPRAKRSRRSNRPKSARNWRSPVGSKPSAS